MDLEQEMVTSTTSKNSFELQELRDTNLENQNQHGNNCTHPSDTIMEVEPSETDGLTVESPSASILDETHENTAVLVGKQRPRISKQNLKCSAKILCGSCLKFWREYQILCVMILGIIMFMPLYLYIIARTIPQAVCIENNTLEFNTTTSESASTPQYGGILNSLLGVVESENILFSMTTPVFTEERQLDLNTTALSSAKDVTNSVEVKKYTVKQAKNDMMEIAADKQ